MHKGLGRKVLYKNNIDLDKQDIEVHNEVNWGDDL